MNKTQHILLIDDEQENLALLSAILKTEGYDTSLANNGKEALKLIDDGLRPDLILLDVIMPGMDGYAVCTALKNNTETTDVAIIFISGINSLENKVRAFEVGGADYMVKPLQFQEVLARVRNQMSLRLSKQQLQETQMQLMHTEKIASLGQLIAGIAHEINSPLGAIRSSAGIIQRFLGEELINLPDFFHQLAKSGLQSCFLDLIKRSLAQPSGGLTTKEERRYRRTLTPQLETYGLNDADMVADLLVDMHVYENLDEFALIFSHPEAQRFLQAAYSLTDLQRNVQTIQTASENASKIIFALKNLSRFDRAADTKKAPTDIHESLEIVLTLYHNQFKYGIEVSRDYADNLPIIASFSDELSQVWVNLFHNALQAMNNKGQLNIRTHHTTDYVEIHITDNGSGIPENLQEKIFEPFFTTKPEGEGTGLGLDIVKKIIHRHAGHITVQSQSGKTCFSIYLPLS